MEKLDLKPLYELVKKAALENNEREMIRLSEEIHRLQAQYILNETDKETQKAKINSIYDQIDAGVAELKALTDEYLAQKSLT
ncbi:MAG: hypothetical protein MUE85_20740 [Microscillaceae bacterium]|jgi:septation ring formation regulator EzrA|nr:hypothetical protein [Microscillaceae bacterium]